MKTFTLSMLVLAAAVGGRLDAANGATTATLAWNPVADPRVTGYVLYWGTNNGDYIYSVACASNQTSVTVSNLLPGLVYYFAVKAASTNGLSDFSNVAVLTNVADITPPLPGGTDTNSQTSGTNAESSGGGGGGGGPPPPSLPTREFAIAGVPPLLNLAPSNDQVNLTILGTVGAAVAIQSTTNPAAPDSWATITNLTLTTAAGLDSQSNPPSGLLADAFVPAWQTVDVSPANASSSQFYRTVMQHGYVILADTVLPAKGYGTRLIVVNMPGFVDDVCYVSPNENLIYYDKQTQGMGVESAGSTIRQIASTYAGSLSLDWTSASELAYSNGLGWVLATVVQTEDPSSDPVAGEAGTNAPIVIDF
jgi:Fibronectin type III domain